MLKLSIVSLVIKLPAKFRTGTDAIGEGHHHRSEGIGLGRRCSVASPAGRNAVAACLFTPNVFVTHKMTSPFQQSTTHEAKAHC